MRMPKYILTSRMLKYGIVGVLGTAIHFISLIWFVELCYLDPVLSSALGFGIVVIVSYYLNKTWTFQSNNRVVNEFVKYLVTSCIGLLLNVLIMHVSISIFNLGYLLSQLIVTMVIPITNFVLNNAWTFKKQIPSQNAALNIYTEETIGSQKREPE
ncbi:GtrA family protein [Paenibacillus xerothermodurans]|uniref:GtrA family protein n=1 Tax=Paenibacillus xerothermodurans TaxID=1977292 RepID=A0A2W1P148_PAEXE|nr:GtrA family protein [Paenibacillus xerothermodurans]